MSEIRSGIRHILAFPWVYDSFQRIVGAYAWRDKVLKNFVTSVIPKNGILIDIGCGTAEALRSLPQDVEYIGFDRNLSYIQKARKRFSKFKAKFYCEELSAAAPAIKNSANVVLALGLIHHLDDSQAIELFKLSGKLLGPEGFFLTVDPVFDSRQSSIARYIISKDRGTAVRTEDAYRELALKVYSRVEVFIDPDPLFIPYTGIVMKCFFE